VGLLDGPQKGVTPMENLEIHADKLTRNKNEVLLAMAMPGHIAHYFLSKEQALSLANQLLVSYSKMVEAQVGTFFSPPQESDA
jgi:uncharacterized protein (AIM24 family)